MQRHASQHNLPICDQGRQRYKRVQSSSQINLHRIREIRVNLCPTKSSIKKEINDNYLRSHHCAEEPQLENDNEINKQDDIDEINLLKVHLNENQLKQDKINNNREDNEIKYCNESNLIDKSVQTNLVFNKDSTIVVYQHDRFLYRFHSYQAKLANKLLETRNKNVKGVKSTEKTKSNGSIKKLNSKIVLGGNQTKNVKDKMKQLKSINKLSKILNKKAEFKSKTKSSVNEVSPEFKQNETGLRLFDILNEISQGMFYLAIMCVSILVIITAAITLLYVFIYAKNYYFENWITGRFMKDTNDLPYYVFKFNQILRTVGYELKVAYYQLE